MTHTAIALCGRQVLSLCNHLGSFVLFLWRTIYTLLARPLNKRQLLAQMETIGVGSIAIVFLTGIFAGLALAFQSYIGLSRVGTEEFIGLVVTLGMTRELGPVLTGLMVTGRVGSSMAAEIGSMQITEQIDALKTIGIDPFHYLMVPRIVGATIIMPFLTVFSMMCGIGGGYIFCTYVLGINPETYFSVIQERVTLGDVTGGLIKAASFGLLLSWVGSYNGYVTTGGARGVGRSTTRTVVVGSILILISNYFLSSLLFNTGIS